MWTMAEPRRHPPRAPHRPTRSPGARRQHWPMPMPTDLPCRGMGSDRRARAPRSEPAVGSCPTDSQSRRNSMNSYAALPPLRPDRPSLAPRDATCPSRRTTTSATRSARTRRTPGQTPLHARAGPPHHFLMEFTTPSSSSAAGRGMAILTVKMCRGTRTPPATRTGTSRTTRTSPPSSTTGTRRWCPRGMLGQAARRNAQSRPPVEDAARAARHASGRSLL